MLEMCSKSGIACICLYFIVIETTKSSGQPSKDRSPRSSSSSSQRHSLRSSTDSDAVPGSYAAAVAHKSVASASSPTEPQPSTSRVM